VAQTDAVAIRLTGAVAGRREVDAVTLPAEAEDGAQAVAAVRILDAGLTPFAGALTASEAMRARGDAPLRVVVPALPGVPPRARVRAGCARHGADAGAAFVAGANLTGDSEAVFVPFARAAEVAAFADPADHRQRAALVPQTVTDLVGGSTVGVIRISREATRAFARDGLRGPTAKAGGAVAIRRAVRGAVAVQITRTGAETEKACFRIAVTRAGRTAGPMPTLQGRRPRLAEGAPSKDRTVPDSRAFVVRATGRPADALHTRKPRSAVALVALRARGEASGQRGANGCFRPVVEAPDRAHFGRRAVILAHARRPASISNTVLSLRARSGAAIRAAAVVAAVLVRAAVRVGVALRGLGRGAGGVEQRQAGKPQPEKNRRTPERAKDYRVHAEDEGILPSLSRQTEPFRRGHAFRPPPSTQSRSVREVPV